MPIRFVMVICIPCAVGLSVLGISDSSASLWSKRSFKYLCIAAADRKHFRCLIRNVHTDQWYFTGNGQDASAGNPCSHLLAIHVVLLVVLVMTGMNIHAVVWANIFFAFLMCVLNSRSIAKYMRYRQEVRRTFFVPLLGIC